MLLQLVFEDQWCIPLLLDDRLREALDAQRERASQGELDVAFSDRISASVSQSISACLDPDLQLPTDSQMKYATDIARELGVSLSADVLRFRGSAHEFIARFEEAFRARRPRRPSVGPTSTG